MRWIQHVNGKLMRGEDIPPDGDVHFVDEQGSMSFHGGTLYINGVVAPKGQHVVRMKHNDITFDVDDKGKATRGKPFLRGSGPNGKSN